MIKNKNCILITVIDNQYVLMPLTILLYVFFTYSFIRFICIYVLYEKNYINNVSNQLLEESLNFIINNSFNSIHLNNIFEKIKTFKLIFFKYKY